MSESGTIPSVCSSAYACPAPVHKHRPARAESVLPESFATYLERLNVENRGLRGDRALRVDPAERSADPRESDARAGAGDTERSLALGPRLGDIERAPARMTTYEQDVRVVRQVYVPAGNLIDVFA